MVGGPSATVNRLGGRGHDADGFRSALDHRAIQPDILFRTPGPVPDPRIKALIVHSRRIRNALAWHMGWISVGAITDRQSMPLDRSAYGLQFTVCGSQPLLRYVFHQARRRKTPQWATFIFFPLSLPASSLTSANLRKNATFTLFPVQKSHANHFTSTEFRNTRRNLNVPPGAKSLTVISGVP